MATAAVEFAQTSGTMPISLVSSASTKDVTRLRDLKTSARDQLMIDPRIIIIENGDVDAKDLPDTDVDPATGRDTVWSEADPGILVVLNGGFNQTGVGEAAAAA